MRQRPFVVPPPLVGERTANAEELHEMANAMELRGLRVVQRACELALGFDLEDEEVAADLTRLRDRCAWLNARAELDGET